MVHDNVTCHELFTYTDAAARNGFALTWGRDGICIYECSNGENSLIKKFA